MCRADRKSRPEIINRSIWQNRYNLSEEIITTGELPISLPTRIAIGDKVRSRTTKHSASNIFRTKMSKQLFLESFQGMESSERLLMKLLYRNTLLKIGGKSFGKQERQDRDKFGIVSNQPVRNPQRLRKH